jgi:hypothetical protein
LGDPSYTWRKLTTRSRSDIRLAIQYLF